MLNGTAKMTVNACTCQAAQLAKPLGVHQLPLSELLATLAAPSPSECSVVREKISQIAADMSQLDDEIERVEETLASLRHNRTALQKLSDRHHNILNITRRLPIEILGEIFIYVQDASGGRSIKPTQVCRQWREVAIATSKLWSHLSLDYILGNFKAYLEMVPIWLRRAGGHPLSITIQGQKVYHRKTTQKDDWGALHAMIYKQSHRWRELKLFATEMMPFLENIPENLPILHTLHIDREVEGSYDQEFTTLNNFSSANALRVLTLGGRVSSIIPEVPWAQLTVCTLKLGGSYTCAEFYFILSKAVNLQSYTMEVDATSEYSPTPNQAIIRHENLSALEIHITTGDNDLLDHLNLFTLPALKNLKLSGLLANNGLEILISLITRSGCSLAKLSLSAMQYFHEASFTHHQLLDILTATPTLSELELYFGFANGLDDALMHILTKQTTEPCRLLPQLTSIKLSVHSAFSYEKFLDLLKSRFYEAEKCAGGALVKGVTARIQTVVLMPWGRTSASGRRAYHLPDDTYQGFIALRDEGLDFRVGSVGMRSKLEDYFLPGEEQNDSDSEMEYGFGEPEEDEDEEDPWGVDEEDGYAYDSDFDPMGWDPTGY